MAIQFLNTVQVDTDVLYVDTTNNRVGIGTTSPGAKLDVQGTQGQLFSVTDNLSGEIFAVADISGVPIMTVNSSGVSYFDGKVGIGTASPGFVLDVHGDSTAGVMSVKNAANARDTFRSENAAGIRTFNIGNDASGHANVLIRNSSGTTTSYLAGVGNSYFNGGNVGIGITAPTGKLTVVSNNAYNSGGGLRLQSSNSADRTLLYFSTDHTNEVSTIQSYKDGTGAGVKSLLLNPQGGNVGIGTTSPVGKLFVGPTWSQTGGNDLYIKNQVTTTSYDPSINNTQELGITYNTSSTTTTGPNKVGLVLHNDAGVAGQFSPMIIFSGREATPTQYKAAMAGIYARSPLGTGNANDYIDGELIFATAGAATKGIVQRMVINKEGLVGIGTTSPGSLLHIKGADPVLTIQDTSTGTVNASSTLRLGESGSGGVLDVYWDIKQASDNLNTHLEINHSSNGNHFTILDGGNVGIGTTSPAQKLDVAGNVVIPYGNGYFMDTVGAGASNFIKTINSFETVVGTDRGSAGFGVFGNSNIRLGFGTSYTAAQTKLTIIPNGSIQFNAYNSTNKTGTPTYLLGTDASGNIVKTNTVPGSGAGPYLPLSAGSSYPLTGDLYLGAFNKISGVANDNLVIGVDINNLSGGSSFDIQMDGATSAFYINNSRNVGIGTTTPSDGDLTINAPKLHVLGPTTSGAYNLAARFQAGNDADNTGASILINHSNDRGLLIKAGRKDGDREVAYFDVVSSGANITNMLTMGKFGSNYNVGIGTTSPLSTLHVESGSVGTNLTPVVGADELVLENSGDAGLSIFTPNSNKGSLVFGDPQDAFVGGLSYNHSNNKLTFKVNNSDEVVIDSSGNVGIGTTSPSQKLQVDGSIKVNVNGFFGPGGTGTTDGILSIDGGSGTGGEAYLRLMRGGTSGFILNHTATAIQVRATANIPMFFYTNDTIGIKLNANSTVSFPEYGAGYLKSDASGNITAAGASQVGPFLPLAGGTMTGTGNISAPDNFDIRLGNANDLQFRHLGGTSGSNIENYSGALRITNFQDDGNIQFSTDNGVGGVTEYLVLNGSSTHAYFINPGNVGIGTTSPGEKLEVNGNVKIQSVLLSNQNNTDVDTGTEAIASVLIATYTAAFFDFVIKKGTNVRSGTVYACHDGTNVEFTETSTQDLGDTSDVTLNVVISTIYLQLQATTTSDDWSVKSLIRAI